MPAGDELQLIVAFERFASEEPDRFEQAVATGLVVEHHERLRDQLREVEVHRGGSARVVFVRAHLFGCVECESTDEDREPAQQPLLALVEQLIAPVDGVVQRTMPRVAAPGFEQMELTGDPRAQILR